MKNLRLGIDKEIYQAYSDNICKKVMQTEQYKNAKNIMAYCPVNGEVDTSLILNDCLKNKTLILPKTDINKINILPCVLLNPAQLNEGAYGILEPSEECRQISMDEIEMVIIPLIAFDKHGSRLGYGGGYYDRFLSEENDIFKLGIAFSLQQADEIDAESHDAKLDMVITEKDIFTF